MKMHLSAKFQQIAELRSANDEGAEVTPDTVDDIRDNTSDCELCSQKMENTKVIVNHKKENFQECSEFSFKTKCWTD